MAPPFGKLAEDSANESRQKPGDGDNGEDHEGVVPGQRSKNAPRAHMIDHDRVLHTVGRIALVRSGGLLS